MTELASLKNLNWVDIVILLIILLSSIMGVMRGFIREVISLATLIVAFIVATMFANRLAVALSHFGTVTDATGEVVQNGAGESVSYFTLGVSYALLFLGTMIIGIIIGFILNNAFRDGLLGFTNRLLGGIFGFIRGVFICLIAIFVIQLSMLSAEAWWVNSRIVDLSQPVVDWLGDIVSPHLANLKEKFNETLEKVNTKIEDYSTQREKERDEERDHHH